MKKLYNHMIDVAFTVITEHENFEDITHDELMMGMSQRLSYLRKHPEEMDAFGFCDMFEYDYDEEKNEYVVSLGE